MTHIDYCLNRVKLVCGDKKHEVPAWPVSSSNVGGDKALTKAPPKNHKPYVSTAAVFFMWHALLAFTLGIKCQFDTAIPLIDISTPRLYQPLSMAVENDITSRRSYALAHASHGAD